ncbi:MAG: basic amino acid ABC transporter substrate-binding protein [Spirochaetales bacterium]|nr:basic amino acid ABC transporter substrate-binding protein [Spirochaetales bacterium]
MKKILLIAAVSLIFGGMLFAQAQQEDDTYIIASDATWPPMEFVNEEGDIVGFDIDLIEAIAEEAGFSYEIKNTAWDGIFAGLANGAYDAIISSVTITEERKAQMAFTQPYINVGQILIVRTEMNTIGGLEDLNGHKVGVQNGTTGDFVLDDYPQVDRMAYDEIGFAVEDLLNKNVDGVVCDSVIAADYVMNNENYQGKLEIVGEPFTDEYLGIAVQKNLPEFLELLNEGLEKVIASGKRDELMNKWLR